MPFVVVDGLRIYYRLEGREDLPLLVFSHSLGCDHGQWDPQIADLLPHFRILRYDHRGHGASDAPAGEYSIARMSLDALEALTALGIDRFAFCGLSLGGMVGQWIGAHAPERVSHLVLANTSARMPNPYALEERRRTVLEHGMEAISDSVLGRFFLPETLAGASPSVGTVRTTLLATDPVGYAGCCAAVRDMDQKAILPRIAAPTLILSGDFDESTPWIGNGDVLAGAIPDARSQRLPTAHLSNVEQPRLFTSALLEFLVPEADRTGWVIRTLTK